MKNDFSLFKEIRLIRSFDFVHPFRIENKHVGIETGNSEQALYQLDMQNSEIGAYKIHYY